MAGLSEPPSPNAPRVFTIPHAGLNSSPPRLSARTILVSSLLEFFTIIFFPLSALVLPALVGFGGAHKLLVNLCFLPHNPADVGHQGAPSFATQRRWILAFHYVPTSLLIAAFASWTSVVTAKHTTTWHMVWLQIALVTISLLAKRTAVTSTMGHIARRTDKVPYHEYIPSSAVLATFLIHEMFPSSLCTQYDIAFRSVNIPVQGLFWVMTRASYKLMHDLLAEVGVRHFPPLDLVLRTSPDGVLRLPDGSPYLICPPDPRQGPLPRSRESARVMSDSEAVIDDIQRAGHVAMDINISSCTSLYGFSQAFGKTVVAVLAVMAVEILALGVPFAVRGALKEPLLGQSSAEGAAFVLLALAQASISLNVGSGLSGAATLFFFMSVQEQNSRWAAFAVPPEESITSSVAERPRAVLVADERVQAFDFIRVIPAFFGVAYPDQQVDLQRVAKVFNPHMRALRGHFPLDTPTAVSVAMRFTSIFHANFRAAVFHTTLLTAAAAPVGSLLISGILCIYFTASPNSISALISASSDAFQRAAVVPTLLVLVTLTTNAVMLLSTFGVAAKWIERVQETPANIMAWRLLAIKRLSRASRSLRLAERGLAREVSSVAGPWQTAEGAASDVIRSTSDALVTADEAVTAPTSGGAESLHQFHVGGGLGALRAAVHREKALLEDLRALTGLIEHNLAHERGLRFLGIIQPSTLSWSTLLAGFASIVFLALRLVVAAYSLLP